MQRAAYDSKDRKWWGIKQIGPETLRKVRSENMLVAWDYSTTTSSWSRRMSCTPP